MSLQELDSVITKYKTKKTSLQSRKFNQSWKFPIYRERKEQMNYENYFTISFRSPNCTKT